MKLEFPQLHLPGFVHMGMSAHTMLRCEFTEYQLFHVVLSAQALLARTSLLHSVYQEKPRGVNKE